MGKKKKKDDVDPIIAPLPKTVDELLVLLRLEGGDEPGTINNLILQLLEVKQRFPGNHEVFTGYSLEREYMLVNAVAYNRNIDPDEFEFEMPKQAVFLEQD